MVSRSDHQPLWRTCSDHLINIGWMQSLNIRQILELRRWIRRAMLITLATKKPSHDFCPIIAGLPEFGIVEFLDHLRTWIGQKATDLLSPCSVRPWARTSIIRGGKENTPCPCVPINGRKWWSRKRIH